MKLRRLFLADDERLVAVKSLIPSMGINLWTGRFEFAWPVLLVDRLGERYTAIPIWNGARLQEAFMCTHRAAFAQGDAQGDG